MIAATEASHTLQNGLTFCFADVVETLELQHLQGQSSHADVVGKYNGRLYIGLFGEPCLAVPHTERVRLDGFGFRALTDDTKCG